MSISVPPATSFEATLQGAPTGLGATLGRTLKDGLGATVQARSTANIVEQSPGVYTATQTSPATLGTYQFIWDDATTFVEEDLEVTYSIGAAFATVGDVEIRLGRDLTAAEEATAAAVITTITGLITQIAGQDDAWALALSPVPDFFKNLCIEKALFALSNPSGIVSESLGAHSVTYSRSDGLGIFLTAREELLIRRLIYGSNSASVLIGSIFQEAG